MGNLLVLTEFKGKSFEGNSAKKPAKLRFTFPTIQSLQNNISSNKLEQAIEKLNTVYSELISAVEISEKIKAEEDARNKLLGEEEKEAKLEEEKMISRLTEVDEVSKRLKNAKIELLKLSGRIGKYKDQFGINVQKGFAQKPPRAISIKGLYSRVYTELMKKIDLYKIAIKDGVEFPQEKNESVDKKQTETNNGVPNWKNLFSDSAVQEKVTIINKSDKEETLEEVAIDVSGKVSEEELGYRRMVGQLGDELELVENYEKNPESVPVQLRDGIKERADKLRVMLSDLTGIKTKEISEIDYETVGNTEFQNLIDKITGYVAPPTKEEHMKEEERLEEYYGDNNVSTKIRELAEKDILYTFNKGMDQVIKAETKQNEIEARESIERSNEEIAKINDKIEERALTESAIASKTQEEAVKTLNGYVEMNNKIEQEQADRMKELKRAAFIIARKLAAYNTAIDLNTLNEIAESSYEEARRLAAYNTAVDLDTLNKIANSSYEEARHLAAQNTAIELNTLNEIIDSAYEEALRLAAFNTAVDLNEKSKFDESSSVEALKLAARNTAIDLNEINQILESSYLEALRLAARNTAIDLEEQNQIAKTASQFAVILASENAKQELLEKRDKLSQEINSLDSSIDALNKKINEYNNQTVQTKEVEIVKPQEIISMEEIKASAEEEAQKIYNSSKVETTKIEQPNRVITMNKAAVTKKQLGNVTLLQVTNKYGEQVKEPKPILADLARVSNMQKNGKAILGDDSYENNYEVQNMDYLNDLNGYLNNLINEHNQAQDENGQASDNSQPVQNSVENPPYGFEVA